MLKPYLFIAVMLTVTVSLFQNCANDPLPAIFSEGQNESSSNSETFKINIEAPWLSYLPEGTSILNLSGNCRAKGVASNEVVWELRTGSELTAEGTTVCDENTRTYRIQHALSENLDVEKTYYFRMYINITTFDGQRSSNVEPVFSPEMGVGAANFDLNCTGIPVPLSYVNAPPSHDDTTTAGELVDDEYTTVVGMPTGFYSSIVNPLGASRAIAPDDWNITLETRSKVNASIYKIVLKARGAFGDAIPKQFRYEIGGVRDIVQVPASFRAAQFEITLDQPVLANSIKFDQFTLAPIREGSIFVNRLQLDEIQLLTRPPGCN